MLPMRPGGSLHDGGCSLVPVGERFEHRRSQASVRGRAGGAAGGDGCRLFGGGGSSKPRPPPTAVQAAVRGGGNASRALVQHITANPAGAVASRVRHEEATRGELTATQPEDTCNFTAPAVGGTSSADRRSSPHAASGEAAAPLKAPLPLDGADGPFERPHPQWWVQQLIRGRRFCGGPRRDPTRAVRRGGRTVRSAAFQSRGTRAGVARGAGGRAGGASESAVLPASMADQVNYVARCPRRRRRLRRELHGGGRGHEGRGALARPRYATLPLPLFSHLFTPLAANFDHFSHASRHVTHFNPQSPKYPHFKQPVCRYAARWLFEMKDIWRFGDYFVRMTLNLNFGYGTTATKLAMLAGEWRPYSLCSEEGRSAGEEGSPGLPAVQGGAASRAGRAVRAGLSGH